MDGAVTITRRVRGCSRVTAVSPDGATLFAVDLELDRSGSARLSVTASTRAIGKWVRLDAVTGLDRLPPSEVP